MAVLWGTNDDDAAAGAVRDGVECEICRRVVTFPAVYWMGPMRLHMHPECALGLAVGLLNDYQTVIRGREHWLARETHARRLNQRLMDAQDAIRAHQTTVEQLEAAVKQEQALRAQEEQERRAIESAMKWQQELPSVPTVQTIRLDPIRNFTGEQRKEIYRRSNGHCVVCGNQLGNDWQADHIHPYARGGKTEVVNGQALCRSCNSRKRAKVLTVDGGDQ